MQRDTSTIAQDEANILENSYSQKFLPNPVHSIPDHINHVVNIVLNFLNMSTVDPLAHIRPIIIHNIIQNLKNRKASRYDNFYNTAFKNLPTNCVIYITHLTNATFKHNYFSTPWKTSIIFPILNPVLTSLTRLITDPFHFYHLLAKFLNES